MTEDLGCGGCNPDRPAPPDAMTVREWDELAARRARPIPLGERLASLVICPDCLLPRFVPSHWLTCR